MHRTCETRYSIRQGVAQTQRAACLKYHICRHASLMALQCISGVSVPVTNGIDVNVQNSFYRAPRSRSNWPRGVYWLSREITAARRPKNAPNLLLQFEVTAYLRAPNRSVRLSGRVSEPKEKKCTVAARGGLRGKGDRTPLHRPTR